MAWLEGVPFVGARSSGSESSSEREGVKCGLRGDARWGGTSWGVKLNGVDSAGVVKNGIQ